MHSIFSDPKTAARGSRRPQERRDFFPSLSDSFFVDPFSSGADEHPIYREQQPQQQPLKQHLRAQNHQNPHAMANRPGAHPQEQYQQQRRHPHRQHQQHHQDEEELHNQQTRPQKPRAPKQNHLQQQFQALKQQQDRQQQPSNGLDHSDHHHQPPPMANNQAGQQLPHRKRQGRRQRQHAQQGFTIKPMEAPEATDDIDSLVQAAFGEGAMSSPVTRAPAPIHTAAPKTHSQSQLNKHLQHSQQHLGSGHVQAQSQQFQHQNFTGHKAAETSEEEEEEEEEEQQSVEDEDQDQEYSEEEEMKPDPEVQARSNKELADIRWLLEGLAEELDQIVDGVITNKKKILLTEENLTKAMLRIDSVDSGGDDAIRKQRKDLVNRAESLLEKVDKFKARTNTHVRTRAK